MKTYPGVHDHLGSEAYGASNAKQNIKRAGKLSPTGTVLVHEWTSLPLDAKPEHAFEARWVFSYSVKHKAMVKRYHTSTGVIMTGVLVRNDGDKVLWERPGKDRPEPFTNYVNSVFRKLVSFNTKSSVVQSTASRPATQHN
ncbi:MAG: hypothetical protein ACPGLY_25685 [Rubripirellula sp.]